MSWQLFQPTAVCSRHLASLTAMYVWKGVHVMSVSMLLRGSRTPGCCLTSMGHCLIVDHR